MPLPYIRFTAKTYVLMNDECLVDVLRDEIVEPGLCTNEIAPIENRRFGH